MEVEALSGKGGKHVGKHVGRIRIDGKLLAEVLGFPGGKASDVVWTDGELEPTLFIEHPDMPLVKHGMVIPISRPVYEARQVEGGIVLCRTGELDWGRLY